MPLAENISAVIRCLSQAVFRGVTAWRLPQPIITLIIDRLREIHQRLQRLTARLRAGTYRPRRSGPRKSPVARKPRGENPLPQTFGWLLPLVPEAVQFRAQLEHLFQDPEMADLIAMAPAAMARVLRPLCWALRLKPPPIVPPSRPPNAAARPRTTPQTPRPARTQAAPASTPLPPAEAPPHPA